jgi:very-short-patch-repair endonuclease
MPGQRKSADPQVRYRARLNARRMRKAPTPAEDALWQKLRRHQLGAQFRRQHSIGRYIVDFYCAAAQLVIEIDGSAHDEPSHDAERQEYLASLRLRVLRFRNAEVLERIGDVLDTIRAALNP